MGNTSSNNTDPPLIYDKSKPVLIIKAGPTGCGKSSIPKWLCESYSIVCQDYVNISIDDVVEENIKYKEYVNDTFTKHSITEKSSNDDLQVFVNNDNVKKDFCDAYHLVRMNTTTRCDGDDTKYNINACGNGTIKETCDDYLDKLIRESANNKKNIVLETTGEYPVDWLFVYDKQNNPPFIIKDNYNIIYVYSVVDLDTLLERNKNRSIKQIKDYFENKKNAPRVTDTNPEKFIKKYKNILKRIKELLDNKENLIVYNNSSCPGSQVKMTIEEINEFINKILQKNRREKEA